MKDSLKNIIIGALISIVVILLFTKGCNNIKCDLKYDTVVLMHSDTVWGKDTIYSFKPVIKPKIDTIYKVDTVDSFNIDSLFYYRVYADSLSDTNQTIFYNIKSIGFVERININYRLKVPIIITNTIDRTITITEPKPKLSLYGGLEITDFNKVIQVSPKVSLLKNKYMYGYRYNLNESTHSISISYNILNLK